MSYYGYSQQGFPQNPALYPGMAQPQQQNMLPQQQVVQANGKASIDALRMAPNSSVLIMDNTAPIVWLCTSDGLGNVTPVPYDITPHKDPPPVDVNGMEERIANIEGILKRWEEKFNGQSYVEPIRAIKDAGDDGRH